MRMLFAERLRRFNHDIGTNTVGDADPDSAGDRRLFGVDRAFGQKRARFHLFRHRQKVLTSRRQVVAAGSTVEKRRFEGFFQGTHTPGHRRMINAQLASRGA